MVEGTTLGRCCRKKILGGSLSNIDSKRVPKAQVRFKKVDSDDSIVGYQRNAADFFDSIGHERTRAVFPGAHHETMLEPVTSHAAMDLRVERNQGSIRYHRSPSEVSGAAPSTRWI